MKNVSKRVAGLLMALFIVLGVLPGIGIGTEKTASRSGEDIVVGDLTVEKTLLFLGDIVVIKAKVSNLGTEVADNMTVNVTATNDTGPAIVIASINNTTVQNITVSGFYNVSVEWNTSAVGLEAMANINYTINVTAWNGTDVASDPTPVNNTALLNVTFKDMSYILMTNVTPSSPEVVKGEPMNLTVNISNLGNKPTAFPGSSATLHAYLDNATLASNTTIIQNIPARTNISAVINITDTNFYSLGNHSFFVELFKSGQSGPRLSDINFTTGNISVVYPNVYLDNVTLYPGSVVVGETMLINATIANNGTAKKDLVKVVYYMDYKDPLNEIWNTTVNVSALGTNTTSYAWNTSTFKAGAHEVFVSLEPAWPSYMNKSFVLMAGGLVNLKVENITIDPPVTKVGEIAAISARIANNGTWESFPTNATYSIVTDFVNKTVIGVMPVAPLMPDSKTTVTLHYNSTGLAFKTYRVEVFVDKECLNCEYEPSTDRLDNMLQTDFPIKADPDLVVSSVNFTKGMTIDTNLTVGEVITINALIRNNGSDSSIQTMVDFTIQNDLATVNEKHSMNLYGIPPEKEFTVQYVWDTNLYPTGNYTVKVEVDANQNNSKDPDRTNNVFTVKTELLPPVGIPNLKVVSFTVVPEVVVQKQRTTLTALVENTGTQVAKGVEARFSYKTATEYRTIDTHAEAELPVGEQMSFEIDWFTTLVPGNYTVRVEMSDTNGEKDPTDNLMEAQVEITPAPVQGEPKVTIVDVEFDKSPKIGQMLPITVTVKNDGTADAKNVQVKLKVDGKPYGDPEPIALIPVGSEAVAVFNYKVEEGTHSFEITVLVDGDQHDIETDIELKAKDEGIDNTTMMLALVAIVVIAIIIFLVLATRKATPEKGVIEEEKDEEEEEDEDEDEDEEEEEDEDEDEDEEEEEDEEDKRSDDKKEEEEEDEDEGEEEEDDDESDEDEEGDKKKGKVSGKRGK